jgi:hypothetical protein
VKQAPTQALFTNIPIVLTMQAGIFRSLGMPPRVVKAHICPSYEVLTCNSS